MNSLYWIIGIAVVVVLALILLIPVFSGKNKTKKLQSQFGSEYDHAVQVSGDEKKAQLELQERQNRVKSLNIRPLTMSERERYLADWADVQSKFVDEPGQAIVDGDRLIMEVMQLRQYPMSDFDQRAADISVSYPALVSNYRAARAIAVKNELHQANTEELRQAMIYYRSLFEELLGKEPALIEEK